MSKVAKNNLILIGVSTSIGKSVNDSASRLITLADTALALRQRGPLELISDRLDNLSSTFSPIADYYRALAINPRDKGSRRQVIAMLERSANYAPAHHRARALLALGSIAGDQEDYKSETRFYIEAFKAGADRSPYAFIETSRAIAILQGIEGNRSQAIKNLKSLLPIARASKNPYLYFSTLNSLAVELKEAGRIDEARACSQIVAASPLIHVYPEWQDTADELREQGREAAPLVFALAQPAKAEQKRAKKPRIDFSFLTSARKQSLGQICNKLKKAAPLAIANLLSRAIVSPGPRAPPLS